METIIFDQILIDISRNINLLISMGFKTHVTWPYMSPKQTVPKKL